MQYQSEITRYMNAHREEMISDIAKLCAINSEKMEPEIGKPFGRGVAQALDTALAMAKDYGFQTSEYNGYVGCIDLNGYPKQLDILAHLDVVPGGEGWAVTQPFSPLVRNGNIYGRGTADDKGPAIAALYGMRAVKELNIPIRKNVRLLLGTDEECGGSDLDYYYSHEAEAPMSFTPDANFPIINVEKGRLAGHFVGSYIEDNIFPHLVSLHAGTKSNVVPDKAEAILVGVNSEELARAVDAARKTTGIDFHVAWEQNNCIIRASGISAHASSPQKGKNALTGLLELLIRVLDGECRTQILALAEMMPHKQVDGRSLGICMADEVSGPLTLAFSVLSIEAGRIDGRFDCRIPVCGNKDNVLEIARQKFSERGFTLLNQSMTMPHYVDGNSKFVKTLLDIYEAYTGQKGECLYTGGGTYVHRLKNGVAFGAAMQGTENRMHGADEFAIIDELVIAAKIYAQTIVVLCEEKF